jgi:hypothetical protein
MTEQVVGLTLLVAETKNIGKLDVRVYYYTFYRYQRT